MHIERVGNGPDLVLLHGWAMHSGIFAPLIPALSERFRLHLVDLPGHGRSRDDDQPLELPRLVQRLAASVPEGSHWLGWSLGGLPAMQLALDRPEAVGRLVLVASVPRFTQATHWPHAVDGAVFEEFAQDLQTDFRGTLLRFLSLEVHGSDTAREDLRRLREHAFQHGEPTLEALEQGLELLRDTDLTGRLRELEAPALFIGGRRDRLVPWRALQQAADAVPEGECRVLAGAGHAPFLAHPRSFAERVTGFLSGPRAQAAGA